MDPLLAEGPLELGRDLVVLDRQESREGLDERDVCAEAGKDRGELDPHGARPDHHQGLGDRGQLEDVVRAQDTLSVEGSGRDRAWDRPGRQDDVSRVQDPDGLSVRLSARHSVTV